MCGRLNSCAWLSLWMTMENVASILGQKPSMRKVMWYIIQDHRQDFVFSQSYVVAV